MVEPCPVFLCRDRVTRGTRRHDRRWTRHCLLCTVRHNTLFFPLATGARLSHQYPSVFQHPRSADTQLRAGIYLASHDAGMDGCTPLPTLVNGRSSLSAREYACPLGAQETGVLESALLVDIPELSYNDQRS